MPILKVIVNEKGHVVGTARVDMQGSGSGAPQTASPVAREGQQVMDVEVEDEAYSLRPAELHDLLQKKYNSMMQAKAGKSAK